MKHLKLIALILLIALSTHLKAGVIDQPFRPDFGPIYTSSTEGETDDGWKYVSLAYTTEADKIYYGNAAVYLQSYRWETDPKGYLMTPEKAGGVGWITFLYKTYQTDSWYPDDYFELAVQVSEDGETFTAIDTVKTPIVENKTWFRYSKIVNNAAAKYVKFELLKHTSTPSSMIIDEIGITDVQTTGNPINLAISFNANVSIEGEVGQTSNIPNAFLVSGNVPGGVTLSLDKGENSPFALNPTAVGELVPGMMISAVVAVDFTPAVKSVSSDFIKVTGTNLPNLAFPITGLGLERTIVEGFNPEYSPYGYGNRNSFDYLGWSVVNGSFLLGNAYSDFYYEGSGVVRFSGSLTSPRKLGGIGSFSFFYKSDLVQESINFIVFSSTDGTTWTEIDRLTASSPYFTQYVKTLTGDANYVKVEFATPSTDSSSPLLIVDAFSITEKDAPLASVSGNEVKYLAENAPYSFTVPVTFAGGLTSNDVTVSIDDAQFQLGTVSANSIAVTYNPEEGKKYAAGMLTVSGGGLNFPFRIPVSAYLLSDALFTDFDGDNWQGSYDLKYYITNDGWTVINGQQINYSTGFNSAAALSIRSNGNKGSLISPPKSGGIGDIQFFAGGASSWSSPNISVYVSEDGVTWGEAIGSAIPAGGVYQEYNYTVNNANAKYVKVTVSEDECYFENFSITKQGTGISKVSFSEPPVFTTPKGVAQILQINVDGSNITSNLTVRFKQGNAFSSTVSTIAAADINNKTYALPVTLQSETGVYLLDTLVISGDCLAFDYTLPLKGYILQDLLYEDFDAPWTELSEYGSYITANGWAITNGFYEKYEQGFGSVAAVYLYNYSNGQLVSPPKSGGIGTLQFYAKISSYDNESNITVSTSADGIEWTPLENVISVTTSSYSEYIVSIDNENAKYLKIAISGGSSCYFENIAVTKYGVALSKILLENQPLFKTNKGVEQTETLELFGENISSDLTVRFKQGNAFSSIVTTIAAADINGKTYELPVKFQSEKGSYLQDTLVISGSDLASDYIFPLKGYILQDLIYQDFNGTWIQGATYNFNTVDGWEIAYGQSDTYSNVYEGSAALYLNCSSSAEEPSSILSVPKSGGVGTISFYYKTHYYESGTFRVVTYKTLGGEPTIIETIEAPVDMPYTYYSKTVNDPDAQYIEIQLLVDPDNWSSLYIDAITVSASGKGIPAAIVPEEVWLSAYNGETDTQTFDLQFEAVEEEIRLSLVNGADFSIDKTTITPATGGATTETVTVTYTPSEFFSTDSLRIESDGLVTPIFVPIYGNILKDKLLQDFNKEGWEMYNDGNTVLDGWVITQGRRTYPYEMIEGDPNTGGSLRLTAYNTATGSLVSPAKSGGINTVEFYYRNQFSYYVDSMSFVIETSVEGQIWDKVDEVKLLEREEFQPVKHLYSQEIKDKDARYFRISANLLGDDLNENAAGYLFVDSIAIDALPYLRKAGNVPEVETTTVPVTIPVAIRGLLNTDASITLAAGTNYTLGKTSVTPAELTDGTIVSFDVTFTAETTDTYKDTVIISNTDIENVRIPLSVRFSGTGINDVSNPVSVYLSKDGVLNVLGASAGTKVTIINVQGQPLFNAQVNSNKEHFNVSLQTGVYIVKVGDKAWKVKK
ncbi:MAG: T9SS type A sorting domain-containing protein [Dysgonamonadaceae bacterium]|jgi:hypothetical protein|nr:T9SS type A sorting domain-containing protein [Dysgonamonadaceae bacterium]